MKNAYKKGVRLSLTISPQVDKVLLKLLRGGLHGRTKSEVAQRLLYLAVRDQMPPLVLR